MGGGGLRLRGRPAAGVNRFRCCRGHGGPEPDPKEAYQAGPVTEAYGLPADQEFLSGVERRCVLETWL